MEFRELKSLMMLAQSGSITETARSVHLTPAAIHKQLKQLEQDLNVPLYERRDGRLQPTAAAEVVMPYFRDILGRYESALVALDEWKGVRRGLVRIGAGPSLAIYVLPRLLRLYAREFPNVDLDVQTGSSLQLLGLLQAGSVDMILLVGTETLEDPTLTSVVELNFEIVLLSSISGVPRRCSLSRLAPYPFLLFRKGARIENLIDRYLGEHSFRPNVRMRFDSAEALKGTLLKQPGIGLLPLYTVEDEVRRGELVRIRQTGPRLMMKAQLLTRELGFAAPSVEAFVKMARTAAVTGQLNPR